MKRTYLPLTCRAVTGAASPVGRPAPRDYHQRDDAEQRGGHQVIGGRQRIAGLRDQPRRRKRGESAEDRHRYAEAERHSDGARLDRKLLRQHRGQDAAVTRLDQVEEADGEYRGGERGKGDRMTDRRRAKTARASAACAAWSGPNSARPIARPSWERATWSLLASTSQPRLALGFWRRVAMRSMQASRRALLWLSCNLNM